MTSIARSAVRPVCRFLDRRFFVRWSSASSQVSQVSIIKSLHGSSNLRCVLSSYVQILVLVKLSVNLSIKPTCGGDFAVYLVGDLY